MFKNNSIRVVILAILVVCMLLNLAPVLDIDQDGALDSLLTEGLILLPAFVFLAFVDRPAGCPEPTNNVGSGFQALQINPPPISI